MTRPSYQRTFWDDGSLPPSSQCVAQSCNLVRNNIPRSARDFFSVESSIASASTPTSMAVAPPERFVLSLLSGISPRLSVQELEVVPSARLQRLYNVKVTEGPSLLLALPPPAVMRLLRFEKSSIGSEAAVLKWLSSVAREKRTYHSSGSKDNHGRSAGDILVGPLSRYLPVLVRHESMEGDLPVEYNLSRPPRGVPVSALSRPLSHLERRIVDFQIGQLLRRISSQISPTRRFGIAADVLAVPPSVANNPAHRLEGGLHESKGAETWRVAFHNLMEAILRDGEDSTIMLSYSTIRHHFSRFEHLLDAVKRPRLVVLDAGEDLNTLVVRSYEGSRKVNPSAEGTKSGQSNPKSARTASRSSERGGQWREESSEFESDSEEDTEEYVAATENPGKGQIEVTGLRQWSTCIFGDPLLASVFSQRPRPSQDFWLGFDKPISGNEREFQGASSSLIEDTPNAHIRILLYECYHAVVSLVGEFYRPQNDSNKRELAARKHLGNVLARLEELDDSGGQRRRRMSGEMSPAKRPRSGEEDNDD
ncbi:hypothetical protein FDECE_16587 [Fusarium decemcellulare]|nr:hypothetical protein FDECE_16587 [Fusarium decemcellulare]